jgi:hypothetical protein
LDELRQTSAKTTSAEGQNTNSIHNVSNGNKKMPVGLSTDNEHPDEKTRKEKIDEIRQKFQYFLRKSEIQDCLNEHRSAMYDLLTSHGDLDDLILFAEHVKDYERVILLYVEREDYGKALSTLEPLVSSIECTFHILIIIFLLE